MPTKRAPTKRKRGGNARRGKGEGGLYLSTDGWWRASIEIGWHTGPDGKPRRKRKVIKRRLKADLVEALRAYKKQAESTGVVTTNIPRAGAWARRWIDEVRPHHRTRKGPVRPTTVRADRSLVELYIAPYFERHKLEDLEQHPGLILDWHTWMRQREAARGDAPVVESTVLRAHAVLSRCLDDAVRLYGYIGRNPCKVVQRPGTGHAEVDFLDATQGALLLQHVADDRLGSRWGFAELTGKRQGECIGLRWDYLDLEAGVADVAWQLQRLPYRHGCTDSAAGVDVEACGRRFAGNCPHRQLDVPSDYEYERLAGGLCLTRPKSHVHIVPLIPSMTAWLKRRHGEYLAERENYRVDHGLVWCRPDGRPLDPRADYGAFLALLAELALPAVKLHSLRHTCATLLGALGIPEAVIMQIVGHSTVAAARKYRHVDITAAREALLRLGQLLRLEPSEQPEARELEANSNT